MLPGVLTRLLRAISWIAVGATLTVVIVQLDLGLTGTLIALWFIGTIGLLLLIAWRARRRDEAPRVELLWDERPDR
ncbi:MAG: hypothetical protein JHC84_07945 [Solirubrobacteraceae bacterium]|nr:hypothetical protein [Solirubrobacteraceae bacterium]